MFSLNSVPSFITGHAVIDVLPGVGIRASIKTSFPNLSRVPLMEFNLSAGMERGGGKYRCEIWHELREDAQKCRLRPTGNICLNNGMEIDGRNGYNHIPAFSECQAIPVAGLSICINWLQHPAWCASGLMGSIQTGAAYLNNGQRCVMCGQFERPPVPSLRKTGRRPCQKRLAFSRSPHFSTFLTAQQYLRQCPVE